MTHTAHALLVALALALGLDPGVGGVGCMWEPAAAGPGRNTWHLRTCWGGAHAWFMDAEALAVLKTHGLAPYAPDVVGLAPTVAAELDPFKALALAALHVLEHP